MKYGIMGAFIKLAFAKTAFNSIKKEILEIEIPLYKKQVSKEYKAIVRKEEVGEFESRWRQQKKTP